VPAGEPDEKGVYPEGSVHGRVMARLEEIAENLKSKGDEKEQEDEKEGNPGEPAQEAESEENPESSEATGGEEDSD
jgi:hypothetical protein